jgi:monovalent cation:proton antiporter-2 (CPA2) family protein
MDLNQFLLGALVYLAATVISAPLASRLGLGSILGFLLAGVVLGPSALGLVGGEGETVKHFAEFGVIVMLFLIGLELEPSKLWALRRNIFGLGLLQVAGTALVLGVASLFVARDWREGLVIGLILAMSSTAIVLQSLQERGILKAPVGQSIFSVLLFQDISVIPILAVMPLLATALPAATGEHASLISNFSAWLQALCILAVVAAIMLSGRYLMKPLFRFVAETGSREIFVAFALLLVVGITLLMGMIGLSAALGTFLAGVVLADSEYRHELELDLQPFKGLLLAIFFISVGAGIDFKLMATTPFLLVVGLVGFIALKFATQLGLARFFKMDWPNATRFSIALTQGSEFGFVLVGIALGLGLLSANMAGLLTAIIVLSMAAAPLLILLDDRIIQPRLDASALQREADVIETQGVDAIIAGHGRFGMTIGRVLTAQGVRTAHLDHDPSQVDVLRKFGMKVFYGDALRLDLLEAAGAKDAKLLVIAIDEREKTTELVRVAQQHFPNLQLFVRAYDRTHVIELMKMGVEHFYRELFGSSMNLARDALVAMGRKPQDATKIVEQFRDHDDKFLRKSVEHQGNEKALVDLARQSRLEIAKVFSADRNDDAS